MKIELTDRYGGRTPSTLRGCFECEAMGCGPGPQLPDASGQVDIDAWLEAPWITCGDCGGTGRVSLLTSIRRLPWWLVKGGRFFWREGIRRKPPASWSPAAHLWLVFKCAYVYDLMRLRV